MQVFGDPNHHADKFYTFYSLTPQTLEDVTSHNADIRYHDLWRGPEHVWHLDDNPPFEHHTADAFNHSREYLPSGDTAEFHDTANFQILLKEWSPHLEHPTAALPTTAMSYHHNPDPDLPADDDDDDDEDNDDTIATPISEVPQVLENCNSHEGGSQQMLRKSQRQIDKPLSPISSSSSTTTTTTTKVQQQQQQTKKKRSRNRLAAARCRKKAKLGVDELQQRERELLRMNKVLSVQARLLRDEVLQLKSEILRHSDCDNDYIHSYIQRAAEQIGTSPLPGGGGRRIGRPGEKLGGRSCNAYVSPVASITG